ncbi:hypothetical protein K438DRAFT_1843452 [Mycena galopus ATCC 62051]|nr:hypothetical protein K438DRAFT_1843452 [Mycena galopus ATCC 62051]
MATETDPLLPPSEPEAGTLLGDEHRTPESLQDSEHLARSKLVKLLFIVAVASTCRGTSMYSRYEYFKYFRPDVAFSEWVRMPGVCPSGSTWASAVVCFMSVGWWSALADRRGRKPVLFVSLLGPQSCADLIYMVVTRRFLGPDAISVGLIIEGLLGGYPTFIGVVHAYAADVSSSSLSRTVNFGGIQSISLIFFLCGAYLGSFANGISFGDGHGTLGYAITVPLLSAILAYIYYTLPESLTPQQIANPPRPPSSSLKYIFAPFLTLTQKGPLVGKSFSSHSRSSSIFQAFAGKMVTLTSINGHFPIIPRWLLFVIPFVANIVTLLFIFPTLASLVKRTYGASEKSGRLLARSLAQNSILIGALCSIGMVVFGGRRLGLLHALFFFVYPFSVGALPALYSLAASYFAAVGRGSELGALFGALSIWVAWGEFVSYEYLRDYSSRVDAHAEWAAFYLVVSLLLLVPSGPPVPLETTADESEEEGLV